MPVLAGPVTPMRAKFCRHVPVDVVPFSADWKARHKVECRKAGVFRPYDFVVSDELENCHKQSAKYILLDEVPADSDSESSSNESEDGNACAGKKWLVGAAADLQELKSCQRVLCCMTIACAQRVCHYGGWKQSASWLAQRRRRVAVASSCSLNLTNGLCTSAARMSCLCACCLCA